MKQLKPQWIGLITGALMITASVVAFYVLQLPTKSSAQYVVYLIYTTGITWSLFMFHKSSAGNKNFKDYFSEGFKVFIVAVLLMVIYTWIFVKMNPQIIDGFIEENNKALLAEGNRTQAEILDNAGKIRSMFLLTMVMGATVTYLIIGALVTLVGSGLLSQQKDSAV